MQGPLQRTPFQEDPLPFRVRCPRCGQTAEITEQHLGRQGQCNNCGSLVAIPARLSKHCFICGTDVADLPHTKDEQNNYLCSNCHQTRRAVDSAFSKLECSICHIQIPREQAAGSMTGPICRQCATILLKEESADPPIPFASDIPIATEAPPQFVFDPSSQSAHTALADPPALEEFEQFTPLPRPPIPQIYTAPAAQFTRRRSPLAPTSRLPLILSSIALLGVAALAILHFTSLAHKAPSSQILPASPPDNTDQQLLTRVLILKAQAEILIDVGKLREGIDKYDALLRIAPSSPPIAAELDSAKSAREKALKLLAVSTTHPTTPTASEEKPIPATDSQKKPGTIFE